MTYRVCARVSRVVDGWQSSFDIPAFEIESCSQVEAMGTARRVLEGWRLAGYELLMDGNVIAV